MSAGVQTIIYPVTDLVAAKALYGALAGSDPVVDQPYYVQYVVDGQQIGLDPLKDADGNIIGILQNA